MRRYLILSLLACMGMFWTATTVRAEEPSGEVASPQKQGVNPTTITIEPLEPLPLGDHPTVTVRLLRYDGEPVANEPIYILVDDTRKNKVLTDSNGYAQVTLKYKFPARTYKIIAQYRGSEELNLTPSRDETELLVEPFDITFRTVPPIAGVRLIVGERIYTTNEDGIIDFRVTEPGMHTLELLTTSDESLLPHTRLEFARWNDNVFEPVRELYLPRSRPLEAGFLLNYRVNQVFIGPNDQIVDPSRISLMTLRAVGRIYTFEEAGPHWLPANRLVRRIGEHLESKAIPYYFQSIEIDGSNVINRSQQRFYIHPNDVLPIRVLVYTAHFSSRDAMFDTPIGTGVRLDFPNGHSEHYPFDSQATISIDGLARGSYTARVTGAGGSAPPIPIHISRDQDVELLVISYLDMAVMAGVPALFALSLLIIGRPHLFSPVLRPFRSLRGLRVRKTKAPSTYSPQLEHASPADKETKE